MRREQLKRKHPVDDEGNPVKARKGKGKGKSRGRGEVAASGESKEPKKSSASKPEAKSKPNPKKVAKPEGKGKAKAKGKAKSLPNSPNKRSSRSTHAGSTPRTPLKSFARRVRPSRDPAKSEWTAIRGAFHTYVRPRVTSKVSTYEDLWVERVAKQMFSCCLLMFPHVQEPFWKLCKARFKSQEPSTDEIPSIAKAVAVEYLESLAA